jgi:hypothetical protein
MASVRSKLGNRIYLLDSSGQTVIPQDVDQWRQCHLCGSIYARYEVKKEADITPFAESVESDNPFDFGSGQARRVEDNRKFDRTGKTERRRKFKQDSRGTKKRCEVSFIRRKDTYLTT